MLAGLKKRLIILSCCVDPGGGRQCKTGSWRGCYLFM